MPIQKKTFNEVNDLIGYLVPRKYTEAIVFLGAGGELGEWVEGITKILTEEEIMTPCEEWYHMTTTGGRHDLVMPLPMEGVNLGRLAIWKLKFGDCSWWSDYRGHYWRQHEAAQPKEAEEVETDTDEIDEHEESLYEDT
jgi:hypothetical protein